MAVSIDALLTELRTLVATLGRGGGSLSPSVYDTAQLLRLYPPPTGVEPVLSWLLSQQHVDGGWGLPDAPYTRAVPTLAALLALHAHDWNGKHRDAAEAALTFSYSDRLTSGPMCPLTPCRLPPK
jgi:hypothetical protein